MYCIKAHIVTGCNWISKVGTKTKPLSKMYLLDDCGDSEFWEEMIAKAVLEGNESMFTTFDEYRHYHFGIGNIIN